MKADPLFATSTGDNRYNDRLPAISEAWHQAFMAELHGFERRLKKIDPVTLPSADRLNYEIYTRLLQNEIGMLSYRSYRMPVSRAGGFHIYFPELYLQMPMSSMQDYENYISRLHAFKGYVQGHIEIMRTGLREGQVPPRVTMEGVPGSLQAHLVTDPHESVFFKTMEVLPDFFPAQVVEKLRNDCVQAILTSIMPGYASLHEFLTGEYIPACRDSIAASDLPDGREYYRQCIRHFTSLDLSPEEIHQVGLSQVARIQAEMLAVKQAVGFAGSLAEFIQFLRTDARFYATSPQELLEKTALVLKRMDGELPRPVQNPAAPAVWHPCHPRLRRPGQYHRSIPAGCRGRLAWQAITTSTPTT